MLLSGPLWAIILSQMCSNWSYYTLLTSLPTYMDLILHFDLQSVRIRCICISVSCQKLKQTNCCDVDGGSVSFQHLRLSLSFQNGFLSALPYLGAWIFSNLSGAAADYLIERRVYSVTVVRKLFTICGKETSLIPMFKDTYVY